MLANTAISVQSAIKRLRRSLIKRFFIHLGYPKNHIMHHLFDGVRIDPVYQERPTTYHIHYANKCITTKSLYDFQKKENSPNNIFIVGSGPSIKNQNLTKLQNEKIFLLNGAIKLIQDYKLLPTGIFIIDGSFIRKHLELISLIPNNTNLFLSFFAIKELISLAPQLLRNPIYLIHELKFEEDSIPLTVKDKLNQFNKPTWGVLDGGTVMSSAIQVAAFIQAKNVWLLGLDINNAQTEPRFYETLQNRCRSSLLEDYEHKILPFMKVASQWYHLNNFNLYNCSPISKIPTEIIPFKNIDSFH